MNWYLKVLKNYANFNGRARRKEYWMFFLFNILISIVLSSLDNMFGLANPMYDSTGPLQAVYSLAVLIPGIAVFVRRLHDIGKSGAWFFIIFVPVIGWIWLLVLLVTEGKAGNNQYGSDPKQEDDLYRYV